MRLWLTIFLLALTSAAHALELDGHTDFAQRLGLNSSISARVAAVHVTIGQQVNSGDLLLSFDQTSLQAGVDMAQAEVDALEPELARMETELDKAQELFDRDSLALVELQTAEQHHAIAVAHLAAAEARLSRARHRLAQTELRAPIDGVVLAIDTFAGEFVNTRVNDRTLLTIASNRSMVASTLLPFEQWRENLRGRAASIRFRERSFRGRVADIGTRITPGANNHPALKLVVEFATEGDLPAGLPVEITIED